MSNEPLRKLPTELRIYQRVIAVLLLIVLVLLVVIGWETYQTLRTSRRVMERAERLVVTYETLLTSDKSTKSLEASLAAAASWQATARLVNTTIVPEAAQTLRHLGKAAHGLEELTRNQDRELTRSQTELRDHLNTTAVKVTELATELTVDAGELTLSLENSLKQIPPILTTTDRAARQMEVMAVKGTMVMDNLEQASQSAPGIAKGMEKVASKAPLYQKLATIGSLVLGTLALIR